MTIVYVRWGKSLGREVSHSIIRSSYVSAVEGKWTLLKKGRFWATIERLVSRKVVKEGRKSKVVTTVSTFIDDTDLRIILRR